MLMRHESSVLVIVDLQERLMPVIADVDDVVAQAVRLAQVARIFEVPVIGTEQTPRKLGSNVEQIKTLCDSTMEKAHFDASADGLVGLLPIGRNHVVVAGCEAHVCVMQTALGLLEHGLEVWLVQDAVGSRKHSDRDAALSRMRDEGIRIVTTEMVAFEWSRRSDHAEFRQTLQLIK